MVVSAYPPYYCTTLPVIITPEGSSALGAGIFIGAGWFSWSWFDWHHHHVYVDVHKQADFTDMTAAGVTPAVLSGGTTPATGKGRLQRQQDKCALRCEAVTAFACEPGETRVPGQSH